jgi:hypothetical protein
LRQYFYEYYASAKRIPFDPERKASLRSLKELSSVFLLAGDRLHWLIEMSLKKGLSRAWLERTCFDGFERSIRYSMEPERNQHLAHGQYPPTMLLEYFCQNPKANELTERARMSLSRAVQNFFGDPMSRRSVVG